MRRRSFAPPTGAVAQLEGTNALVPPDEADEQGLILRDPLTMGG